MTDIRRVLITGTTSGLGRGFLDYYSHRGVEVISVNRRADTNLAGRYPNAQFEILDIADARAVTDLLQRLQTSGKSPDLFILSAGVNRPDNFSGLDYGTYREVMNTNLDGVMTFVGAISSLGLKGRTIAGLSSTSNIVPNPAHIAYHVSKWAIKRCFGLLARNDPHNTYKVIVLGPVRTNIMARYPQPEGLQKRLFEMMAVNVPETVEACAGFFTDRRRVLNYPFRVYLFYQFVRTVLTLLPGVYRGTQAK